MEWIFNNWYFFVIVGLVAAMFIFGRRPEGHHEEGPHDHGEGTHDVHGSHKGGGCCH